MKLPEEPEDDMEEMPVPSESGEMCGVSGGIFDLYALYTGVSREDVRKELVKQMGIPEYTQRPKKNMQPQPESVPERPMTDVDSRHAAYSALLSKLTLAADHRENLLNRGLTEDDITRLGYKTTPVVGMTAIASQLQSEGFYFAGVPGFFRNENGAWTFTHEKRGILIPVRDRLGRIQWMPCGRLDTSGRPGTRGLTIISGNTACRKGQG